MSLVMHTRTLLGLSLIVLGTTSASCGSPGEGREAASPKAPAKGGENLAAEPGASGAAFSFDERRAKLPTGAAFYFAVNLYDVEDAAKDDTLLRQYWGEAAQAIGGGDKPVREVLKSAAVDIQRPVMGAIVPASEARARPVIDAAAQGTMGAALEKVIREHAADATHMRVLIPLAAGTSPWRAAERLIKVLAPEAAVLACPSAPACSEFGAAAPLGLGRDEHATLAFYDDGGDLRVDVAVPLFVPAQDRASVAALVAFRDVRGGTGGSCTKLDGGATASFCVDAEQAGQMGASMGYGMTVGALASFDPANRKGFQEIAAAGRDESRQNLKLAAPSRKLASDGTVTVFTKEDRPRVRFSWALTEASRAGVQKAFSTERCAKGPGIGDNLLPAMLKAFGDPGPEFSNPDEVFMKFREAGFAAYAVAFAGTWPNLLPILSKVGGAIAVPTNDIQVCARHEGDRLHVQWQ